MLWFDGGRCGLGSVVSVRHEPMYDQLGLGNAMSKHDRLGEKIGDFHSRFRRKSFVSAYRLKSQCRQLSNDSPALMVGKGHVDLSRSVGTAQSEKQSAAGDLSALMSVFCVADTRGTMMCRGGRSSGAWASSAFYKSWLAFGCKVPSQGSKQSRCGRLGRSLEERYTNYH